MKHRLFRGRCIRFWLCVCVCLAVPARSRADDPVLIGIRGELNLDEFDLNAYAKALTHPTVFRAFRELALSKEPQSRFPERPSTSTFVVKGDSVGNPGVDAKQRATFLVSQFLEHVSSAAVANTVSRQTTELNLAFDGVINLFGDAVAWGYAKQHFWTVELEIDKLIEIPYLFARVRFIVSEAQIAEQAEQDGDSQSARELAKIIKEDVDDVKERFRLLTDKGLPAKGILDEVARGQVILFSWKHRGIIDANRVAQGKFNSDQGNKNYAIAAQAAQQALDDCWDLFSDQFESEPFVLAPR